MPQFLNLKTIVHLMKYIELPLIELFGIATTRGMLGAGLALLLSDKLSRDHRRLAGSILAAIGIISTAPFAYDVLRHRTSSAKEL
jgi:hypothetical protein